LYFNAKNIIIIALDSDAQEDAIKLYNKLDGGKLRDKIFLNNMPDGYDISSFNAKFGPQNLKKWLSEKCIKLTD
jgi:hypothetical protein